MCEEKGLIDVYGDDVVSADRFGVETACGPEIGGESAAFDDVLERLDASLEDCKGDAPQIAFFIDFF